MEKSDVIIVGGIAAGPKTAAVLARRNPALKITLFEKSAHISVATCGMPYFASGDINSFAELTATSYDLPRNADFFENSKGFTVITGAEVIAVDRNEKTVKVRMSDDKIINHQYDKLVLATGAEPNRPPFDVPANDKIIHFTRPEDAIAFRQSAQTGQIGKAVIIGAGFIGCELAEAVGGMWGIETVLIEKEKQVLPYVLDPEMADIVVREMKRNDIELHLGCTVNEIILNNDGNPVIQIAGGENIEADFVFLCTGVSPNTRLASECGLDTGSTGGIIVNESMQTSDPDIYAGGDCIETRSIITGSSIYMPMGSLANRQGRVIAENITGNKAEFRGTTGAFLVKVFETNVGAVGLSQRSAEMIGMSSRAVWGAFPDCPDYYPESKSFSLKLVYDENNRLLGLQAVGEGDICRRIDSFSALLTKGGSIEDLFAFEHGYAPPYAEALDPLHHLAGMAQALNSGYEIISPSELAGDGSVWLDVRETEEAEDASWPELEKIKKTGLYLNIPLNELKKNIDKLDKHKRIKIICRRGPRSYQAAVILRAAGFENVAVIGGGTKAAIS